jgi:hypothetical protein
MAKNLDYSPKSKPVSFSQGSPLRIKIFGWMAWDFTKD